MITDDTSTETITPEPCALTFGALVLDENGEYIEQFDELGFGPLETEEVAHGE